MRLVKHINPLACAVLIGLQKTTSDLAETEYWLWKFLKSVRRIRFGVRDVTGRREVYHQLPKALPTAFRRLVMFLVAVAARSSNSNPKAHELCCQSIHKSSCECEQFLREGMDQLFLMMYTDDYRDRAGYEAIDSSSLLGSMMSNLLEISCDMDSFHMTDLYKEYTVKLVSKTYLNILWGFPSSSRERCCAGLVLRIPSTKTIITLSSNFTSES